MRILVVLSKMKIKTLLYQLVLTAGLIFFISPDLNATHNRSGQITFEHLYGNTYRFTVTTCTKTSSEADRPELEILWGDGTKDTIPRADIDFISGYDAQKNFYYGTHTYAGPGTFTVSVEDPNRNSGVVNIDNSVNTPFCIETEIVISPFVGDNDSPIFSTCPCPEYGCLNIPYYYNVGAYDPDGDSLSFAIVPCKGEDCLEMPIPSKYQYPNTVGGGLLSIDSELGTLTWDSPTITGEYNFAILISEYRSGVLLSRILHDVQVTIQACSNLPPEIEPFPDTCIFAGDTLFRQVIAIDTDYNSFANRVNLTADGEPFDISPNNATFDLDPNYTNDQDSAVGYFEWIPDCSDVRANPYKVFFTAEDNDPSQSFRDLFIWRIKVNAPPPENLTVQPQGNAMSLTWSPPSNCTDIEGYKIYISTDSVANDNDCCPTGGPSSLGYTLIGSTDDIEDTTFLTEDLIIGNEYCFMITAILPNGSESCPSIPDCDQLLFEVPVMTNVSVITTDASTGTDTVIWATPKELQTSVFGPPYHYKLYRSTGFQPNNEQLVLTTPDRPNLQNNDTLYLDPGLNTEGNAYTYAVELYSNGTLVGKSTAASSVYLSITPNDNQLELSWEEDVPWTNSAYEVYRETSPGSGVFNLIATTTQQSYIDDGLINQKEYCYRVRSIGQYTSPGIVSPLYNWSQIVCAEPHDNTPPCPPTLTIEPFCEEEYLVMTWNNPNNDCADDVTSYNIYYTAIQGEEFSLLTTISSSGDTTFTFEDMGTIAGCYYVTATDSIPYNNESDSSNIICVDNCPIYELPNIITPNGDGLNDLFHPLIPYRYVEGVRFRIFDRWGLEMFYTEDIELNWDGTNQKNGAALPEGVYFYTIEIDVIRLSGLETINKQGFIHLVRD